MMRMSLSTWSIRNPVPATLLFLVLTLAGTYAFRAMPINNMPNTAVPMVAQPTSSICSVGLGAGDGSPAWSEIDVTANRSIDLDLTEGAGMTVACGTAAGPGFQPAASGLPGSLVDPSAKGDFGSL